MTDPNNSPPHPLRPYYVPREEAFVVSPPSNAARYTSNSPSRASNATIASRSSGPAPTSSSSSSSGPSAFSRAGQGNRYLSPSITDDVPSPFPRRRLRDPNGGVVSAGHALLYAGGMRYASTLLAMPFEVGKILLQIQWTPRPDVYERMERRRVAYQRLTDKGPGSSTDHHSSSSGALPTDEGHQWGSLDQEVFDSDSAFTDEEDQNDDQSSDSIVDSSKYFGDPTLPSTSHHRPRCGSSNLHHPPVRRLSPGGASIHHAHPRGGRVSGGRGARRRSQRTSESVSVMPTTPNGGVWEMIKAIARGKEGVLALFKGALTTFLMDISNATLQPALYGLLSIFVPGSRATVLPASELFTSGVDLPLSYSPRPWRALSVVFLSHVATGVLISPLDLVRTRLVAQSLVPTTSVSTSTTNRRGWWSGRKYIWPWDALHTIRREEGGWIGVYLHPNLLVPTLLDYTFRPLIALATPLLIDQVLRTEPGAAPARYALAELVVSTLGLLVTLPIETIRRRLQVQTRFSSRSSSKRSQRTTTDLTAAAEGSSDFKLESLDTPTEPKTARGAMGRTALPGLGTAIAPQRLRTCVLTRPEPYAGVLDALVKIVREESTPTPRPDSDCTTTAVSVATTTSSVHRASTSGGRERREVPTPDEVLAHPGYSSLGGLRNLYRGFSMGFGANLLVFLLTIVSGERGGVGSWTEM